MGIQEILEVLKRAQEIDREIHQIREKISEVPETLHHLIEAFELEKAELARLEAKLKEAQLKQKQKEGELGEKEALIRKYDSQLSQVKTNKEYSAVQQEIASLRADRSLLEDQILSILEEMDLLQGEVGQERERLAQVERESGEKKKQLTEEEQILKTSLTSLNAKRSEILSGVLPEARELYDRIVEKKESLAVVPVEGEVCGACRLEIRPQLLNEIKLKEALIVCENCSRILYLD